MSVKFTPVQWTTNKWVYDAVLVACVVLYIVAFIRVGNGMADVTRPVDGAVVRMRAYGSCAFLMLTFILCIGPLARIDRRFLPLLYNRRHFGVLTAVVAAAHAGYVLGWYYAFSPTDPTIALLTSNTNVTWFVGFPFELLGLFALLILAVLAATSHDFWLQFLTPPVWKAMHLSIYAAYAAVVAHVSLGYLQDTTNPAFGILFAGGALCVVGLHLFAPRAQAPSVTESACLFVADIGAFEDGRAIVVTIEGNERAAVFRNGRTLSAVSNACAHQNGPLGEGRIIDGCITCPWHGFQYRPEDGCSPAPFTERIPTYRLRLDGRRVLLDPAANPPGTAVPPLDLPQDVP